MKAFLYKQQLVDAEYFEQLEREADELAARLREGCLTMPDPEPLRLFDNVYEDQTPLLRSQRERFAAYLDSFEGAH